MKLRNLLIYRLIIINLIGSAVLVWSWQMGWLDYIQRDASRISYVIIALFGFGIVSVFIRAVKVTQRLNQIKSGEKPDVNGSKFLVKNEHIEWMSSTCGSLGIFGTVIGIMVILLGDGGIQSDGSLDSVKQIIRNIMLGGGIAFVTTGVGLAAGTWLSFNAMILRTASISMIEDSSDA